MDNSARSLRHAEIDSSCSTTLNRRMEWPEKTATRSSHGTLQALSRGSARPRRRRRACRKIKTAKIEEVEGDSRRAHARRARRESLKTNEREPRTTPSAKDDLKPITLRDLLATFSDRASRAATEPSAGKVVASLKPNDFGGAEAMKEFVFDGCADIVDRTPAGRPGRASGGSSPLTSDIIEGTSRARGCNDRELGVSSRASSFSSFFSSFEESSRDALS